MVHPAIRKGMTKKKLSQRIHEGRAFKAPFARGRGPTKDIIARAKRKGVPKKAIYYKGGGWHVPNKKRDQRRKASYTLNKKKRYDPSRNQEWRGDHHKTL